MNKTEQGVHRLNEVKISLIQIILLVTCCLAGVVSADELPADADTGAGVTKKQRVFVLYSADSGLQSDIIQALSNSLQNKLPDTVIIKASPEKTELPLNNSTDIIIGIGSDGIQNANTYYPGARKLFISSDPNKYRLDNSKNKGDAILYMSQPYCRQVELIKLIRDDWKVIGLLSSNQKPVDTRTIESCAKKYDLKLYAVKTSAGKKLSDDVKQALEHSDVLLALPDKNIYNGKTVKNILLTSYRYRKPVFAFSKNFVDAGALASIHSSTLQIGERASELVEYYFMHGLRFKDAVNYPGAFDVSINRQVFKALGLATPDTYKLKQKLIRNDPEKPGHTK